MADDAVEVPTENQEYPVFLGDSLLARSDHEATETDQGDAAFALFQYKFTPASVDTTIPGLVSVDDSSVTTVLRGTSARSEGGITFKGKLIENKETECLLIFDGSSFRLERCDFALAQLRPIRSAPATRKPLPRLTSQTPLERSKVAARPQARALAKTVSSTAQAHSQETDELQATIPNSTITDGIATKKQRIT